MKRCGLWGPKRSGCPPAAKPERSGCITAEHATYIITRGRFKMKKWFCILSFFCAFICGAAENISGSWTESGTLPYSYAYARSYIGYQMRKAGWVCKIGFTSGAKREIEHSLWHKGDRKMQIMIWRIEAGKTGWSKGEISSGNQENKQ